MPKQDLSSRMTVAYFIFLLFFNAIVGLAQDAPKEKPVTTFYGVVHLLTGEVRVKAANSFNWEYASVGDRLDIGDYIFVANKASVTLRIPLNLKEFVIPEGTILRFSQNLPKRSDVKREFSHKNKGMKMKKADRDPNKKSKFAKKKMEQVTYKEKKDVAKGKKKEDDKKKKKKKKYNVGQKGIMIRGPKDKYTFYNKKIRKQAEDVVFSWRLTEDAVEKFFKSGEVDTDYKLSLWREGEKNPFCCEDIITDNGRGEGYYVVKVSEAGTFYFQVSTVLPGGTTVISDPQMFKIKEEEPNLKEIDLNNLDGSSIIIQ